MIVYKLNEHGQEVWSYPATRVLEETENYICIEAFFNRDKYDLGYVTFERDDRFVEYFYNDRWYNIFVVYSHANQQLKGWYCNICRPAMWENSRITCEDLALDVWINPDGSVLVTDEDAFALLDLSDEDRAQGQAAVTQLLELAQAGKLPN